MTWWLRCLDLGHGSGVDGLDVILELGDLFAQLVDRRLVVLNHAHDLEEGKSQNLKTLQYETTFVMSLEVPPLLFLLVQRA